MEEVIFWGGPGDGEIGADDRRLPHLVFPIDGGLAVYERTDEFDQNGRRIYRYVGDEVYPL